MAAVVTVEEVKEIFTSLMTDNMIQLYIDSIEEKVGACIDSNYSDETGLLIKINMVAYMLSVAEGVNEATSKKAPNGASVTYNVGVSEDGIKSNPYGRIVYNFDSSRCWAALIPKKAFITSAGPNATSLCRSIRGRRR